VLHAVHERDRDLVPVLALVRLGQRDVAFFPGDAEIAGDRADHRARVIAQVTARL